MSLDAAAFDLDTAEPDLVRRLVQYLQREAPEVIRRMPDLEQKLRAEFAGDRAYIRQQRAPARRAQILRTFNGRNATEVARALGIGRATVYRHLKQPGAATP